jgi:streptogramin lyase
LWVAYPNGSGLAVLNRRTNTLTPYQLYDREPPNTAVAGVAAILEDPDGTLWFGTHGNGLLKLDPERRQFVRYRNHPGDPASLSQDTQLALFEDHEGTMWVAAAGSGIDQFALKPLPFKTFQHQTGNPNSLDRTKVNGIYEDGKGILWVGTEGGLNRIDPKTGKYTLYRDGDQNNIVTLTGDGSRYLWTGSFGSGLKRFDTTTGTFKVYLHNPSDAASLSNNIVVRVFRDHAGTIWAGTADGLDRFNPATKTFTTYRVDPEKPSRQSYVCIAEDQQGLLWLGTQNSGLQRFNPVTGKFTVYEHDPDVARALSNDRVLSLYSDHAGTLWIGTQNGLNRFDPKTQSFTTFDERDGLPAASIDGILENHTGDLWLSSNRGLSKFDSLRKTFTNYTAADGLSGDEFGLFGACFQSQSGEMFFGGPSGVTAFYPDRIVENPVVPPMVLTDFRLFASPVSIGNNSPLQRSIGYTRSMRLSSEQSFFSLEFSALSYRNPTANRYRYKLDPLEAHWNETTGNNRAVTYTTLPPGNYVFRAQGATSRGPWNPEGITLSIEVLPPWWSTWWFESMAAVAILALFGTLYRLRLRQIAHQFDVRLEDRVAERTRIARDLHDNLRQGFHGLMMRFQLVQKMLPERPAEAEGALNIAMDRAARAITEGRDAVQALRNKTSDGRAFVPALMELGEEMTALYVASDNGRSPGAFRLLVEGRPETLHPILQDELYGIAREAVGNAFRHARAKNIEVDVRFEPRTLRLRVRDDGIGMEVGVTQGGRAGHWGLPGMRERAKNIGARFALWSEAGAGTEIEVIVRASIAYRHGSGERRDTA